MKPYKKAFNELDAMVMKYFEMFFGDIFKNVFEMTKKKQIKKFKLVINSI